MPITPPNRSEENPAKPGDSDFASVAEPDGETRPAELDGTVPREPEPEPELVPRAGLPILSCGSQDPIVPELFGALAELGIETPTSRGQNPHGVIGVEEIAAVRSFRREHGVSDDPEAFGGDHDEGRKVADSHIGPWSIEAILRAREALVA